MMTNEGMKAAYESLNSEEDAYKLMKDNGYTGTMEDFMALCAKAAEDLSMNMDDMERVAGGFGLDDVKYGAGVAWEKTKEALSKTWDWIQENPGTTAEIVGGTIVAAAGITYVVMRRGGSSTQQLPKLNLGEQEVLDYSVPKGHDFAEYNNGPSGMRESISSSNGSFDFYNN